MNLPEIMNDVETVSEWVNCRVGDFPEPEWDITVKENMFVESRRWYNLYSFVVELGDKYFRTEYMVPATEMQDDIEPFEYGLKWTEVRPVEVKTIMYEAT